MCRIMQELPLFDLRPHNATIFPLDVSEHACQRGLLQIVHNLLSMLSNTVYYLARILQTQGH